jgi:hypothetical protein
MKTYLKTLSKNHITASQHRQILVTEVYGFKNPSSINLILNSHHYKKINSSNWGQESLRVVTLAPVISSSKQTILVLVAFFYRAWLPRFRIHRNQDTFRGFGLCSCNILFQTNNFGPGADLFSCSDSELQVPPSPGLEFRANFSELWPL